MATYLDRIAEFHRARASADGRPWIEREVLPPLLEAKAAFEKETISVIAEVKKQSPSAGVIADIQPEEQARRYIDNGAAAISVLTDGPHFGGSLDDLRQVTAVAEGRVAVLRKDFTVCENDVLDAAENGANIVLLIATILTDGELAGLSQLAVKTGLLPLFEVHDVNELRRVEAAGAALIGVNQRDLRTFKVDTDRAVAMGSSIPRDVIAVAESGVRNAEDAIRLADAGYDAILVGESVVTSSDWSSAVAGLSGHPVAPNRNR